MTDDLKRNANELLHQGQNQYNDCQYEQAIASYRQSLEIYTKDDRIYVGYALNNLGLAFAALGLYPQATTHYERALKQFPDPGSGQANPGAPFTSEEQLDLKRRSIVLSNFGLVFNALGMDSQTKDYQQAENYQQQAQNILQRLGATDSEIVQPLNNLGCTYQTIHDLEKQDICDKINALLAEVNKLDYGQKELEGSELLFQARTLNTAGVLLRLVSDFPLALSKLNDGIKKLDEAIASVPNSDSDSKSGIIYEIEKANLLASQGDVYRAMGNEHNALALQAYRQALEIFQKNHHYLKQKETLEKLIKSQIGEATDQASWQQELDRVDAELRAIEQRLLSTSSP
jgi:tetratricopeptide (TPR) repeat protein